jgi:hypothetical protein
MKVSTLMIAALLSASCFAAPIDTTALDSLTARAALAAARADSAPVAPPAPGIDADANVTRERWARIKLPKPHDLESHFAPRERQAQT